MPIPELMCISSVACMVLWAMIREWARRSL